jgi:rhamnose transport system ATP-binding protein
VSFELKSGEVIGLTGLAGSGKEELGRALFGAHPVDAGVIEFEGEPFEPSPARSVERGVAYIPDDRKAEGVILGLSVARNISLPALGRLAGRFGNLSLRAEREFALSWATKLEIKAPDLSVLCATLSGGNQQKTALAKWLATDARLLILSHPTQEIDVGVKFELYRRIADLSRDGASVIIISSEFQELLGLCHRILVMRDGRIGAELDGETADTGTIMRAALGREQAAGG